MLYPEKSSESRLDRAVHWIRRIVALKRAEGLRTEHAIEDASIELGTTTHRAKALFYRDRITSLSAIEHDRLRIQFAAYLHRKIADEERRLSALREEADALDREINDALDMVDTSDCRGAFVGSHALRSMVRAAAA